MLEFLLICKNNENYFKYIFPILLNKIKLFEPKFYIYENNSTDNTKNILQTLSNKNKNIIVKSEDTTIYNNKYKNICIARNKLLDFYRQNSINNNKWVILLDTNIIFNKNSIIELINNSYNGLMIISNTKYYSDIIYYNNKYYYDLLALDYGKYFKNQINFDNNKENIINVKSGFGGLVLIDRNYILNNNWHLNKKLSYNNLGNIICEHWDFCHNLNLININNKNDSNINLIKNSMSLWFMDEYINDDNKNKIFYKYINKIF